MAPPKRDIELGQPSKGKYITESPKVVGNRPNLNTPRMSNILPSSAQSAPTPLRLGRDRAFYRLAYQSSLISGHIPREWPRPIELGLFVVASVVPSLEDCIDILGHYVGEAKKVLILDRSPNNMPFKQRVIGLAEILISATWGPITSQS